MYAILKTGLIHKFVKLASLFVILQWDQSEKEQIWRCIPMMYFFILLSLALIFLAPFLANRYLLFGTWTAPQPVNGPILPQPAPAG